MIFWKIRDDRLNAFIQKTLTNEIQNKTQVN